GLLDHRVGGGAELDGGAAHARRELLRVPRLVRGDHGGVHLRDDGGDLLGGLRRGGLGELLARGGWRGRRLLGAAGGQQAAGQQSARSQEEAATADGASAHREFLPRTGALVVAGHRRSSPSSTASSCSVRSSGAEDAASAGSVGFAAGSSGASSAAVPLSAGSSSVPVSSSSAPVPVPSDHTFSSRGCSGEAAN